MAKNNIISIVFSVIVLPMKNFSRHYSSLDTLLMQCDQALRAVFGKLPATGRANPAQHMREPELSPAEKKQSVALMRVNHAGEICAQALYQSQALVSRSANLRKQMQRAALEESDHLAWCQTRITELDGHVSYLNPLWYVGSLVIGTVAGMIGDQWSLGFLAETEQQVVEHLEKHLHRLPKADEKSACILNVMRADEQQHREEALHAGASVLPWPIKKAMSLTSKLMVNTAYWI